MLKPLGSLARHGRSLGWNESEIQAKQEKLRNVLLNPYRPECCERVVAVFAHGQEALRVAEYQFVEAGMRLRYWAVQKWSICREGWFTQKHYSIPESARDRSLLRDCVLRDAVNWDPPVGDQLAEKWGSVLELPDVELENLFDVPEKLAEFWYDAKVFMDSPWLMPDQGAQLSVLASRWGSKFRKYEIEAQGLQKPQQSNDATIRDESAEPALLITITQESSNNDAKGVGVPICNGTEVERCTIDVEQLKRLAGRYGITKPSSSGPASALYIWFQSVLPNKEKLNEEGVETYYSLHVLEIDGRELEPQDYQWVADMIGTKFDKPLENQSFVKWSGVTLN